MKTYNMTPGKHKRTKRPQDRIASGAVDVLNFNMDAIDLDFEDDSKDDIFFRVVINFDNHRLQRVLCIN